MEDDVLDFSQLRAESQPEPEMVSPEEKQKDLLTRKYPSLDGFAPAVKAVALKTSDNAEDALLTNFDPLSGKAGPSAAGNSLQLVSAAEPGAGKSAGAKRWLKGRASNKRKKLDENTRLEKWLDANGVWVSDRADWGRQPSGVSMAVETRETTENEVSGRGLVSRRDINLGEELARVPFGLLFTKKSSVLKWGPEYITAEMSEFCAIALQLIWEKHEGQESFYAPYLDVLPTTEEIGASFSWTDDDLDTLLGGSPLRNSSYYVRERVLDEFRAIQANLTTNYPDVFPAEVFTSEEYIWAYAILFSRAVRLDYKDWPGDFVALVPYIDLINHNPSSDTFITGDVQGTALPLNISEPERVVVVSADRYYNKYEQIYISYGPKSNGQLLMLYGFSMERNAQDFLEISVGQILEESALGQVKKAVLDAKKVESNVFPLYRDRFTQEMMQFLRLVTLNPEDIGLGDAGDEEVYKALLKLDLTEPTEELSERRSLLCLRGIVQGLLSAYPTTVEEDEALLRDRQMFELLPRNHRNALRVRYGEKLIMRASIATIDRIINNLGRLSEVQVEKQKKKFEAEKTLWGRLGLGDAAIKATNLDELMKELDMI